MIVLKYGNFIYFYKNSSLCYFDSTLITRISQYNSLEELCKLFNHVNMPSLKAAIKVQVLVGWI